MRISIIIALLILIVGGLLGWKNQQRLIELRGERRQLVERATRLGISTNPNDSEADKKVAYRLRREHEDRLREARDLSLEFLVLAQEMERVEKGGGQPDHALQKRGFDLL